MAKVDVIQSVQSLASQPLKKKESNKYFKQIVKELNQTPNDTYEKLGKTVQNLNSIELENLDKNLKGLSFLRLRTLITAITVANKIKKTTTPEQMKINRNHWDNDYPQFMYFLNGLFDK